MEAVISLARALSMSTVAEGIETGGQEELLRILGCDLGKGTTSPSRDRRGRQVPCSPAIRTALVEVTPNPLSA